MYHGLSAFNRTVSIYALIKRIKKLASVTACYADRPIGPIGVFVDIEHADKVAYIADRDMRSYDTDHGQREIGYRASFYANYINDKDYLETCNLYQLYKEYSVLADRVDRHKKYSEVGAIASPDALWVNPKYGEKWVKIARVLSRKFNLHLMVI